MSENLDETEICSNTCKSKCCRSTPPALTTLDFEKIKKNTEEKNWYTKLNQEKKDVFVIAKKENSNDCFFLSIDGSCTIYEHRPLDCRLFPLFLKIEKISDREYNLKWLVWYCPLTEAVGIEKLKTRSKTLIESKLSQDPDEIFEYQEAMYISKGYKRKHFLIEERLKIRESD